MESFQKLYFNPKYQVLLTITIISTNETVTTPYCILDNCIKTVSEGEAYIENSMSHRPIKVHCKYTDWYKPGIGYIKGIIEENSDHGLTGSIKFSIQLEPISE